MMDMIGVKQELLYGWAMRVGLLEILESDSKYTVYTGIGGHILSLIDF